jgi:mono/diheme cytochrome c family protein
MGETSECAAVIVRSLALALIAVVSVAPALAAASNLGELVAEGEKWWKSSPDRRDPVTCATCHHDRDETRGWAASFPKYRPLPPPEGRVMTLLQANAEAVRRHYGLADPERPALALTAYLISRDIGVPVSPGTVAGQPAFEGRLRALAESVGRGKRLFADRCHSCHASPAVARAALLFPRATEGQVESLERFLGRHRPEGPPLGWDAQPTADIIAFLMSTLARQPVGGSPERSP